MAPKVSAVSRGKTNEIAGINVSVLLPYDEQMWFSSVSNKQIPKYKEINNPKPIICLLLSQTKLRPEPCFFGISQFKSVVYKINVQTVSHNSQVSFAPDTTDPTFGNWNLLQ